MAKAKQQRRRRQGRKPRGGSDATTYAAAGGLPRAVVLPQTIGPVHRMARTFGFGIEKGATDIGRIYPFGLLDVPNSTEFTALFMEWRVDSVSVHFTWVPPSTVGATPRLLCSYDPTATTAPASASAILSRRHTVWSTSPTSRDFVLTFKPRVTSTVQKDPALGTTTAYAVAPGSTFISTGNADVRYYALLLWIEFFNTGIASCGDLNALVTLRMSFRGLR